ncbi:telomere zinc finger-associated protein-like [Teleopsis dalmanni]|uniref:telomere zinc finger-associated protein-like n=1 Tax=Teleopsis dalmanni TaxID=139649 RepID=UPI0018CE97CE|nr:telomere zinc finger-associated protein-like [Teleopsis dalmanni]
MFNLCNFCGNKKVCNNFQESEVSFENKKINARECLKIFASDICALSKADKICKKCFCQLQNSYLFVKQIESSRQFLDQQKEAVNIIEQKNAIQSPKQRSLLPKEEVSTTKRVSSKENLKKDRRVYRCTECPEVFYSFRQCTAHQKLHEKVMETTLTNICAFCCSLYASSEQLAKHQIECHSEGSYNCVQCPFKHYKNKGHLLKHISSKHQQNSLLYYCTLCNKTEESSNFVYFLSRHMLEQHFYDNHLSNDVEMDMNEEFLDEFLLTNSEGNDLHFSECWDALDLNLPDMMLQMQANDKNVITHAAFQCPKCYLSCTTQNELLQHLAHKHQLETLICNKCEASYNNLNEYRTHKSECQQNNASKSFTSHKCPYCEKRFMARNNFKQHLRIVHTNFKRHVCQLCDKQFATLDHLRKHVLSQHQNERKHICHVCAKSFTQLCHLKQHLTIHTVGKTIKCSLCEVTFWKKIDLQRHIVKKHNRCWL